VSPVRGSQAPAECIIVNEPAQLYVVAYEVPDANPTTRLVVLRDSEFFWLIGKNVAGPGVGHGSMRELARVQLLHDDCGMVSTSKVQGVAHVAGHLVFVALGFWRILPPGACQ